MKQRELMDVGNGVVTTRGSMETGGGGYRENK